MNDDRPNGSCDECGAAIPDAEPGDVRRCPVNPDHDPYTDGMSNGGDPVYRVFCDAPNCGEEANEEFFHEFIGYVCTCDFHSHVLHNHPDYEPC